MLSQYFPRTCARSGRRMTACRHVPRAGAGPRREPRPPPRTPPPRPAPPRPRHHPALSARHCPSRGSPAPPAALAARAGPRGTPEGRRAARPGRPWPRSRRSRRSRQAAAQGPPVAPAPGGRAARCGGRGEEAFEAAGSAPERGGPRRGAGGEQREGEIESVGEREMAGQVCAADPVADEFEVMLFLDSFPSSPILFVEG